MNECAHSSARESAGRDLVFSIALETLLLKHKVSQGYSPAGEGAGSLTPFEMTAFKNDTFTKKSKLYHY